MQGFQSLRIRDGLDLRHERKAFVAKAKRQQSSDGIEEGGLPADGLSLDSAFSSAFLSTFVVKLLSDRGHGTPS